MPFNFKVEGMDKLLNDLEKIGQVPQKHVTASARKGMNIALRDSKANAPYDTGMLKKGIVMKGEQARVKGKKVYRIVFDRNMNDVFQKPNKEGKVTGYYPISQEYGFFAKNGRYIPGYRFISDSLINNTAKIEKTIVSEMQKRIDIEIMKAGLK
jgi:HK97 gp10 family phage protein